MYYQLENKLLMKVINYCVKEESKVFKRFQRRSNLQQGPYKHSTCIPRRNNVGTMFSRSLQVVLIRNTCSVFLGLRQ